MLEEVWNQLCIVKVNITYDTQPAFYCRMKRIHYPHMLLPKVSRFYSALGDDHVCELVMKGYARFVSYTGNPIPWTWCLGLCKDAYYKDSLFLELLIDDSSTDGQTTIRDPESIARLSFFNSMKEAEAMMMRGKNTTKSMVGDGEKTRLRIMDMKREDQAELWSLVCGEEDDSDDDVQFKKYTTINPFSDCDHGSVPVKFYICGDNCLKAVRTFSMKRDMTVQDGLEEMGIRQGNVYTQGVQIAPNTPLADLFNHMTAPDNLIHLVVHL